MSNIWDDILSGNSVGKTNPQPSAQSGSVWDTVLSGVKPTNTTQPQPQSIEQQFAPVGFEGIDFNKTNDKDLRNVQRDWIHPSDLDYSSKQVQEKIGQGERRGDFIVLPETNVFDKYSGMSVYMPEDNARMANATAKYPDTQLTGKKEGDYIEEDIMDRSKFITVKGVDGNESQQLISNKDYYWKKLREGGDNHINAILTAGKVGMELLKDYRQKDFKDMTIKERMLENQKLLEVNTRIEQQKQNVADQGVTGRETIDEDYNEPEGFLGQFW